jgi:hypothetical protein
MRVARDLAWEYSVHDEVERRLALLEREGGLPGKRTHQPGLTETTVKSFLPSAMRKLEARSRYEAVVVARRAGLLP